MRAGLLTAVVVACAAAQTAQELIPQLKDFQKTLGWTPTGSFLHTSERQKAYYRCYYTGKLELPDSYEGLGLRQGDAAGCRLDEQHYDVFFYRIEAVAKENAPLTDALAEAHLERATVVVLHEDFHQQEAIRNLPERIAEAASTLIGFVTAAEFARTQFGENSPSYRNLAREADLFLQKALRVNRWHAELSALYRAFRDGKLTREETLRLKAQRFAQWNAECREIEPEPRSFNRCLPAANNAGLAFDFTYTRYYPLMYETFVTLQRDPRAFLQVLAQARARSEADFIRNLNNLLSDRRGITEQDRGLRAPGGPRHPQRLSAALLEFGSRSAPPTAWRRGAAAGSH